MSNKATATKGIGITLFFIGVILAVGSALVLQLFFALVFVGVIVIGLLLIRKGNKMKEKEKAVQSKHEQGWEEEK